VPIEPRATALDDCDHPTVGWMIVRPIQCPGVDLDCGHDVRVTKESLDESAADAPPSSRHHIGTTHSVLQPLLNHAFGRVNANELEPLRPRVAEPVGFPRLGNDHVPGARLDLLIPARKITRPERTIHVSG
jgi:hypothetical protein